MLRGANAQYQNSKGVGGHTHTFTHTCTLTRKYTFSLSLSYTHTTFSHLKACLCSISLYRYLLSVDNHLDYPVPDLLADIVPSEGNQVKDASMVSTYHVQSWAYFSDKMAIFKLHMMHLLYALEEVTTLYQTYIEYRRGVILHTHNVRSKYG